MRILNDINRLYMNKVIWECFHFSYKGLQVMCQLCAYAIYVPCGFGPLYAYAITMPSKNHAIYLMVSLLLMQGSCHV